MTGYDDIKLMYERERQKHQYFFIAGGTIESRRLIQLDGSGSAIAATANIIDVAGAEGEGFQQTTGIGFNAEVDGIVTLVSDAPINAGRALKAGFGGLAGQMVDADLVESSICSIEGQYGGTWTNDNLGGITSRVHIISGDAADTFAVLIFCESATAGSFEECLVTLNGTTSVPVSNADMVNDEISNILGVSFIGGEVGAGIITIGNTGSATPIVIIGIGASHAGYYPVPDGRAYNAEVSISYTQGAGTRGAHIGLYGYNSVNTLTGEVKDYRGSGKSISSNVYREVVGLLVGSCALTSSALITVRETEDDEQCRVGMSLEEVAGVLTEFSAKLD